MVENNKNKNSNNLDKFNSLIDQATQSISCDSNCQKQRTGDELKKKYLDAQTNLATAPNQVEMAKKNYIIFTQGQLGYEEQLDSKLKKKATTLATFYADNFNKEAQNILSDVETYSGLLSNLRNVFDLFLKYKKENSELFKQLKEETNDILTNERKTYYQDQGISNLKFYYYYFLITIYIICVFAFGIFNFIYPSEIEWKIRLVIFILLLIMPFISTWILGKIISVIYNVYDVLPTNVHTTI
jgi:hypothetical protein